MLVSCNLSIFHERRAFKREICIHTSFKAVIVDLRLALGIVVSDRRHLRRGQRDLLHIVVFGVPGSHTVAEDIGRGVAGKFIIPFARLVVPDGQRRAQNDD